MITGGAFAGVLEQQQRHDAAQQQAAPDPRGPPLPTKGHTRYLQYANKPPWELADGRIDIRWIQNLVDVQKLKQQDFFGLFKGAMRDIYGPHDEQVNDPGNETRGRGVQQSALCGSSREGGAIL